jgi:isopentenyl phosphate kinase
MLFFLDCTGIKVPSSISTYSGAIHMNTMRIIKEMMNNDIIPITTSLIIAGYIIAFRQ